MRPPADPTIAAPLSAEQQKWYDAAARLDPDRMRELLVRLVNIPSPTGGERAAAEFLADHLCERVGLAAAYQPVSGLTGNAHGVHRGDGDGANLLLYAPLDTHIEPDRDRRWVGRELRPDMVAEAHIDGDLVIGLGASNPKCMIAGLVEVAHATVEAGVPLRGDLALGFAGGGMPVITPHRDHYGCGTGVHHLLNRGLYPDMAVIMKPWFEVFPEEPGMAWFTVTVRGTYGYAGTPGFRSSIVPAATVIQAIEAWLPRYAEANTSGWVRPDGWISAVRAGDPGTPAFPSAATEIYLDCRINPRTTPGEVRHQFARLIAAIRARHPEIELDWEMYGSMPGGATDPRHWIVQSCRRGWEQVAGRPYVPGQLLGGQTDGTVLRQARRPDRAHRLPVAARERPRGASRGPRRHGRGVDPRRDARRAGRPLRRHRHPHPSPIGARSVMRILNIVPVPMPPAALAAFEAQLDGGVLTPGVQTRFLAARAGATTIDSPYEQTLADAFVLDAGCRAEDEGYDAVCINSVSDSALAALRSRLSIPVVGAGQAAMLLACQLGSRFSVVTMWPQWHALYTKTVTEHGLAHRLASIHDIGVRPDTAELLAGKEEVVFAALERAARAAIDEDGADVIVLGSTTMHQSHAHLAERLDVPVINPGVVANTLCELLVRTGLSHSKRAYPAPERPQDDLLSAVPTVFDPIEEIATR
ncbi:aspartate/glutamate racemase family protein [Pseudonocardia asaccharolytica]|uniref:Hydantoin racemase n=1 Tax=Pseudonocardia asaccharolytica DSM 44247 = NBRC 16224 TaxID=1123024 RepID=A0A511D4X8_9PSEU|nr:aspartate/glutamate racemase family protein [Pseudonocardia asaccharolytica]GEL19850.1 hypothetical protein PA7_36870 [Pseudonocardia asaccharolytica DSM 44247 = NBRC 16224]